MLVSLHDRINISGDRYTLSLRQDMLDRVGHRLGQLDQKVFGGLQRQRFGPQLVLKSFYDDFAR